MRADAIREDLNRFLDRYSPPRVIANNPQAQQDEVDAMLKQLLRHAPKNGATEFTSAVFESLSVRMQHRSWPTVGELVTACRDQVANSSSAPGEGEAEVRIISKMAEWFDRTGGQMPGFGRPSRTAALIRGGFLHNERFARFKGFDLDDQQRERAREQRMSRDEWEHHTEVLARLRGVSQHEAKVQERERQPLQMPDDPIKRFGGAKDIA